MGVEQVAESDPMRQAWADAQAAFAHGHLPEAKSVRKNNSTKNILISLTLLSITNLVLVILAYTNSIDLTSYAATSLSLIVPFVGFNMVVVIALVRGGRARQMSCWNVLWIIACVGVIAMNALAISNSQILDTTSQFILTQLGTQNLIINCIALYQIYKWKQVLAKLLARGY